MVREGAFAAVPVRSSWGLLLLLDVSGLRCCTAH